MLCDMLQIISQFSLLMPEQQCLGTTQAQCMVWMGAYISLSLPDGPALLSLLIEPSA